MATITWCIEDSNKAVTDNHGDNILGAGGDDCYGNYEGTKNDYNEIVRGLSARVVKRQYQEESYSASYIDVDGLILQTNISCGNISKVYPLNIKKQ